MTHDTFPPPSADAPNPQREFLSLMMARVRDAFVRQPFFVDGALDVVEVCRRMRAQQTGHALVRDGSRLGMFTTSDLRDALLRDVPPAQLAVRDVAHFELIEVEADAEVFEALLLMLRHRVHRVVVREAGEGGAPGGIVGVLGQLDLMAFVSNHSHLIALQIEQAADPAALAQAARRMDELIVLLHGGGIRIEIIGRLVRELNRQLFAKLWSLLAPPAVVENSCLVVMGSEGRGEQVLKTDQDNALLLRDGVAFEGLADLTARFTAALIDCGYPPCPGGIMVSTPLWCQPLAAFKDTLRGWMFGGEADGAMNLAIFLDAAAVAGDAALLQEARRFVDANTVDSDAFFARFASAIDQFGDAEAGGGWWGWLTGLRGRGAEAEAAEVFDLKKLGTFPLVHGVRALALQHHLHELGTAARLAALGQRGVLPAPMVRDLTDALHLLMALKLENNLRQRRAGEPVGHGLAPASLGTLERDRLKDALAIIRRFRQHLRVHFRLESL